VSKKGDSWPDDVDGDVFQSLSENDFDFNREYLIDINLDFDHWPLKEAELLFVKNLYPGVQIVNPEPGEDIGNGVDIGFLQFQVKSKLSYEYITTLQAKITKNISSIGGWCNSWGVLHD